MRLESPHKPTGSVVFTASDALLRRAVAFKSRANSL
jgi:hypothetical protein